MKCEISPQKCFMKNLLRLITRKSFSYSVIIGQKPDYIFDFIKDPQSWYRFDFHEILYIQQDDKDMIINTKSGRGIFENFLIDSQKKKIQYTIHHFLEGKWKFKFQINEIAEGSQVHFNFSAPAGLPDMIFEQRAANFIIQLDTLKMQLSKSTSRQKQNGTSNIELKNAS